MKAIGRGLFCRAQSLDVASYCFHLLSLLALIDEVDQGACHYGAIGIAGHLGDMFRSGESKADREWKVVTFRIAADSCNEAAQIRRVCAACSRNTGQRDTVDKGSGTCGGEFSNRSDTFVGCCGWDQEDERESVLLRCQSQWYRLFGGQIRNDEGAGAVVCRVLAEAFNAIGHDGIIVAHQDQGNVALSRYLAGNLQTAFDGHTAFEGNVASMLNGRAIGERVAEGHTQLDDVSTCLRCCQRKLDAAYCRGVAAHEVGNKYASPFTSCLFEG